LSLEPDEGVGVGTPKTVNMIECEFESCGVM
jgi:hypothetical protein